MSNRKLWADITTFVSLLQKSMEEKRLRHCRIRGSESDGGFQLRWELWRDLVDGSILGLLFIIFLTLA